MAYSGQITALANEFIRIVRGWGWFGGDTRRCNQILWTLGELQPHPSLRSAPWEEVSGCVVLARMGFTEELIRYCRKSGGSAYYQEVGAAFTLVGDTAALEKLASKGNKEQRRKVREARDALWTIDSYREDHPRR